MKEFVKMMLAVICAFLVMQIVGFFLFFIMIGSMAALGSGKTVLPREGVLDVDMAQFSLAEQTVDDQLSGFSLSGFSNVATVGLWDAIQAIDAAAADPGIKYILLRPDGASAGTSDLEELRNALTEFRKSGKAVVAYTENPSNGSYYLASACDKIYMTSYHGGMVQMTGLAGRMIFLKDVLDKVGVNYQLIRHGKYKSAGEMYIKNAPSEENREQNQVMVNSLWNTVSCQIAESRGIPVEDINGLIDSLKLNFPEDMLREGLVDELLDHEGLVNKLCGLAMVEDVKDLHLVPLRRLYLRQGSEPRWQGECRHPFRRRRDRRRLRLRWHHLRPFRQGNRQTPQGQHRQGRRPPRELSGRQRRGFREDPYGPRPPEGGEAARGLLW